MAAAQCPHADDIAPLVFGLLPDACAARANAHLAVCLACRELLRDTLAVAGLIGYVAERPEALAPERREALRSRVLRALRNGDA
jgi:hypothetical protein